MYVLIVFHSLLDIFCFILDIFLHSAYYFKYIFCNSIHKSEVMYKRGDTQMELLQLQYFVKVARLGSITKAAHELHVSQP